MKRQNIASYQVAVAREGKIIYEDAFGYANVEKQILTTGETMFLVGSIEKPFVSTALMILSERGRIDLHKPVNDYIGDPAMIAYQGDASHATISRLLLHTTGMPYGYYVAGNDVSQEQKRTYKELIDLSGVIITPPGTRYMYTNIGYGLFDEIVHDVVGENIKEFIKREIIDPLRLPNTRFFKETPSIDLIATQNAKDGVLPITFDNKGYTALYSTATDLVRFGMFHMKSHLLDQKPILTDESIDILWKFNEPKVKFSTRRMCWDVQQDFGFETVQHGGGGPGIHNWLYMIPSENIIIAILSNSRYNSPESDPVLKALINASLTESGKKKYRPNEGRGWFIRPKTSSIDFHGEWIGIIKGPKGECRVDIKFDHEGFPSMKIEGNSCSKEEWISPSTKNNSGRGSILWRFNACIPYLNSLAVHDEVIIDIWPDGDRLIGSASAAKEKNFGRGENYVLPQYIELKRK